MTPENKKIWKTIGIIGGILLILSAIGIVIYKSVTKDNEPGDDPQDEQDPEENNYSAPKATTKPAYDNKGYTFEQVEKMQAWLLKIASLWQNNYIVERLRSTGGIDGKMGDGFNDALREAIRVNYVKDLADLYKKSIS